MADEAQTTASSSLSRRYFLLLSGAAAAAAGFWSRRPGASRQAGKVTTATLTAQLGTARMLISLAAAASGTFERVRTDEDDTRLTLSYPNGAGVLSGQQTAAPGFYGLDFTAYPAGPHAEQYLQDLFDNTPFSYLGFYFTTTGHPATTGSWNGKAVGLLAQGWNLVPIYVGRQQYWPHTTDNQISASTTTASAQGSTDGKKAVTRATGQQLPPKSRLYLDIEATQYPSGPAKGKNGPPTPATIAYIQAWLVAVNASGKFTGALYDANSRWTAGKTTAYDASVISALLGAAAPATWVAWDPGVAPAGVPSRRWPLDANGDVAALAVKAYSKNPQWAFAGFATAWQFKLDWVSDLTFLTDTGAPRPLASIAPRVDLDVSRNYDPGNTNPGRPKLKRRAVAASVAVDKTTVKAGASVTITVKLDRPAPAPNGTLVLLRCNSPYVVFPGSVRILAKAASVTVSATAVAGSPSGSTTVQARVLHQLSGALPGATIQIAG